MLRAIMEGCAFAVYDNLKVAEANGRHCRRVVRSGGATRSAEWCQIKADVTGKPFVVARRADGREGGHTLGLFAMTAHAMGLASDIGACVGRLLPQRQVYSSSPERHALYEELFGVYMSVSRKLMLDFDRLASISQGKRNGDEVAQYERYSTMNAIVLEDRALINNREVPQPVPEPGTCCCRSRRCRSAGRISAVMSRATARTR